MSQPISRTRPEDLTDERYPLYPVSKHLFKVADRLPGILDATKYKYRKVALSATDQQIPSFLHVCGLGIVKWTFTISN